MHRKCDICYSPAIVDTKTIHGYWAYLCEKCNNKYGLKQWNTPLAGLSEGGTPIPTSYQWNEGIPFYSQSIYKDMRKALMCNTIKIITTSGRSRMVTEGNIVLLRHFMNIAVQEKDYPTRWEVVEF